LGNFTKMTAKRVDHLWGDERHFWEIIPIYTTETQLHKVVER